MSSAVDLYTKHVPKGRAENLAFRKRLVFDARKSQEVRDAVVAACRADILFYVNTFGFTFDPRTTDKAVPMVTYPFQDRAILFMLKAIKDCQRSEAVNADVVIEKSRDMGATWLVLFLMEWLWHFEGGNSFLAISRVSTLVDEYGNMDALFPRIDFIHQHLPEWLMPKGWNPRKGRKEFQFDNPENGSKMIGVPTTGAAGVGGRHTAIFVDEFSRVEPASEAAGLLSGTADTSRCRIFNFTPWGTSHPSYNLAKRTDTRKLRLHWPEHPQKREGLYRYNEKSHKTEYLGCRPDGTLEVLPGPKAEYPEGFVPVMDGKLRSIVYDAEERRRGNPREMAIMWDIDYQGSTYQFYPKSLILDRQREWARPPLIECDLAWDEQLGKNGRLVVTPGGPIKLWAPLIAKGEAMIPPPARYAAGADVSEGSGATNSCFSLGHVGRREKVLEFATPFWPVDRFASACVALCRLFATGDGEGAKLCWETPGPGNLFGKAVMRMGFGNVHLRTNEHSYAKKQTDTPGWHATPENKRILHGEYRAALSQREFVNPSYAALEECLAYETTANQSVEHTGGMSCEDPTGAGVNHGDRVVADALCLKMMGAMPVTPAQPGAGDEPPPLSLAWRLAYSERLNREQDEWA